MKSEAAKKDSGHAIKDKMKVEEEKRDSEEDDLETEEALQWLEVEWKSLAKILKETDPEIQWNEAY